MTGVTKIVGSPGTGKTRKCIDIATNEIDEGLSPEDLIYISFTKSAAQEAKERISERTGIPEYKLGEKWRNLHSMCFKLLSLSSHQVATGYKRRDFCNNLNIDYSLDIDNFDSSELSMSEQGDGNRILNAYDWLQSRNDDIIRDDNTLENMFDFEKIDEYIDPYKVMHLWDAYKKKRNLVDFSDMLKGVLRLNKVPDGKVMIVDEFQDTSPLDFDVYKLWKDGMERVYVAGDEKQCIFQFRNSRPDYLVNEGNNDRKIFLKKTYRVPKNIWREADKIASQMDDIEHYDVKPINKGGEFSINRGKEVMSDFESRIMKELYGEARNLRRQIAQNFNGMDLFAEIDSALEKNRDVMGIFRTRLCALDFQNRLISIGIPFQNLRENSNTEIWTRQMVNLRDGIRELAKEGNTKGVKKRAINKLLDDSIWHINKNEVIEETIDILINKSQLDKSYDERTLLAKKYPLNYYQSTALVKNLQKDRLTLDPSSVRIGTKHTAKGKEADVVITSFDTSWRIVENAYYPKGDLITDQERKVDFVALTRAKKRLVIQESVWENIPNHSLDVLQGIRR